MKVLQEVANIQTKLKEYSELKWWNFIKRYKVKKDILIHINLIKEIPIFEISMDLANLLFSNNGYPINKKIKITVGGIIYTINDSTITHLLKSNKFIIDTPDYGFEIYAVNNRYGGHYKTWLELESSIKDLCILNLIEIINYSSVGGIYGGEVKYIRRADNRKEKEMGLSSLVEKVQTIEAIGQDQS